MARPPIEINEEELEKLSMMQCTVEEIAEWFGVSKDTIERRFAATIKRGRAMGVMSMKRQLFTKVEEGDLGAIVWWSKNFAGMSDKVEQKVEAKQETIVYEAKWNLPEREVQQQVEDADSPVEALPAPSKTT